MKDKEASAPGLSGAEAAFALLVYRCSNFKLSNYEAWTNEEEGSKPLWPRLEELGLIFSVGSYKWAPTQKLIDMLTAALTLASAETVAEASDQPKWRCFHCDETFNDAESAALHFGKSEMQSPACQIDIAEYRAMEQRMHRYNEEDTDLHREIHGLRAKHQVDLMREEEKGYARGLADGMKEASQQQEENK